MGFPLQNRGGLFVLEPGHPNVLAGRKRPFHTIIPGFMERGDAHIGFGIMGGANQPLAHAQFVSNVVDYGMNLQQALEAPRFFKASAGGCDVAIEARVPEPTLRRLSEMGHDVILRPEYCQEMGRGQAVLHDSETGETYMPNCVRNGMRCRMSRYFTYSAAVHSPRPMVKTRQSAKKSAVSLNRRVWRCGGCARRRGRGA